LHALDPPVREQLEALTLAPDRPLLICDADEVLFAFMAAFVAFIEERGLGFDWSSFALTGNVLGADGERLEQGAVRALLARFFVERTEAIPPVAGAAAELRRLAARGVQVLVLSNVPPAQKAARERALTRHGMAYPLVANAGSKGAPVAWLAGRVAAPCLFVDDIGRHHADVAAAAARVRRFHMTAHPRLAALQGPIEHVHGHAAHWPALAGLLHAELDAAGF
jgi:hypothetical protein